MSFELKEAQDLKLSLSLSLSPKENVQKSDFRSENVLHFIRLIIQTNACYFSFRERIEEISMIRVHEDVRESMKKGISKIRLYKVDLQVLYFFFKPAWYQVGGGARFLPRLQNTQVLYLYSAILKKASSPGCWVNHQPFTREINRECNKSQRCVAQDEVLEPFSIY